MLILKRPRRPRRPRRRRRPQASRRRSQTRRNPNRHLKTPRTRLQIRIPHRKKHRSTIQTTHRSNRPNKKRNTTSLLNIKPQSADDQTCRKRPTSFSLQRGDPPARLPEPLRYGARELYIAKPSRRSLWYTNSIQQSLLRYTPGSLPIRAFIRAASLSAPAYLSPDVAAARPTDAFRLAPAKSHNRRGLSMGWSLTSVQIYVV
jgi:hypothetical protein